MVVTLLQISFYPFFSSFSFWLCNVQSILLESPHRKLSPFLVFFFLLLSWGFHCPRLQITDSSPASLAHRWNLQYGFPCSVIGLSAWCLLYFHFCWWASRVHLPCPSLAYLCDYFFEFFYLITRSFLFIKIFSHSSRPPGVFLILYLNIFLVSSFQFDLYLSFYAQMWTATPLPVLMDISSCRMTLWVGHCARQPCPVSWFYLDRFICYFQLCQCS